MTPAARVQAAIEVLDRTLEGVPAEKALTNWARGARYAGSKDRAAVRDHVFQALRCRRSYAVLGGSLTGRGLMIGLLREEGVAPETFFTGEGYAPAGLSDHERMAGLPSAADLHDLPDWLIARFQASLGAHAAAEMAHAARHRAPVTLRVNLAKSGRASAVAALKDEGVTAIAHADVPTALVVTDGTRRVARTQAYLGGLVELQDASSQAAMAQVPLPASGAVLDYCAGGGGKTLALAARAGPSLSWYLHDADFGRMRDAPVRADRAGVPVTLCDTAELSDLSPFSLILCDVPCSGSGTWRRAPDSKWTLTPERLDGLLDIQDSILTQAAPLLEKGGALVYATCSVLAEENEERVNAFLSAHPSFSCSFEVRWSISEGGDGFFLSVLSCK